MAFSDKNIVGKHQSFYVMPETPGGGLVYPVAGVATDTLGGALRVGSTDIAVKQERVPHPNAKTARRDFIGSTYPKLLEAPVSITTPLVPPSDLNGVPEAHHLLTAAFGRRIIVGGTSITYSPDDQLVPNCLSIGRLFTEFDRFFGEWGQGLTINEFKLEWTGNEPPKFTFTGELVEHYAMAQTAVVGATVASDNFSVTAGDGDTADIGARMSVGADNNGGVGHELTGIVTDLWTSTGAGLTLAGGEELRPYMPDAVFSSQAPLGAVEGSIQIDSVAVPIQSIEFSVVNGLEYRKDEVATSRMSGVAIGDQLFKVNVTARASQAMCKEIARRKRLSSTRNMTLVAGAGAGRTCTLQINRMEPDVEKLSVDVGMGTIAFPAMCVDTIEGGRNCASLAFT